MRRITIKEVAKAAGVSAATVSYVMNDLGKVTPEVEAHVRQVAREMGYARSRTAAALKTGRHRTIGCLLPTLLSPIFPHIAKAVQLRAEELGFATLLIDTGDNSSREAEALQNLADHGIDGAVAVLNGPAPATLPFPVVTMDAAFPGSDSIRADHVDGARQMARLAAELGHHRVGLLFGSGQVPSSLERREGFLQGAAQAGLALVWQEEVSLDGSLSPSVLTAMARRDVSLIACVNDMVAIGVLSAARDLGIRVPDQLSVLGFDDMPMSGWPLIGLTTIRQPCTDLGRHAVDLLIQRIDQKDAPPREVILPVAPVLRSTTARHHILPA